MPFGIIQAMECRISPCKLTKEISERSSSDIKASFSLKNPLVESDLRKQYRIIFILESLKMILPKILFLTHLRTTFITDTLKNISF